MVTSVVTGLGVVAPTGIGARSQWDSVLAGKSGIGRITRFDPSGYPVRLAGEVLGFEARDLVPGRLIPQTGRWTHLGLVAADLALADAVLDPHDLTEFDMALVAAAKAAV
jgi:act minimal PKS chain-length factor (CLF/KS beta)